MSNVLRTPLPPARMTVAEFQAWEPPGSPGWRWHLMDGDPVAMAPASEDHGRIQARATVLLDRHLQMHRPGCDVVVAPAWSRASAPRPTSASPISA